jgi:hypothetical protein
MTVASKIEDDRMCRIAVPVLILMQAFSTIVERSMELSGTHTTITPEFAKWFVVELSPILLLLLVRRSYILVSALAVPIVAIFCGRIHYGMLFMGSRSLTQWGDWALWLNLFFGLVSAGISAVVVIARVVVFLVDWLSPATSNSRKDSA